MRSITCLILLFAFLAPSTAFAPRAVSQCRVAPSSTVLFSESKKKKGGVDSNLRNKLLAESIAPWRTVRLFLYGSMGSGALVGGIITLTGALAAASSGRTDFDMNTEVGRPTLI